MDTPDTQDAYVYALGDVANVKLSLKDLEGAQKDLATCQRVLDTFDSVETVVHASFYRVNADYYHVRLFQNPIFTASSKTNMTLSVQARIRLLLQKRPPLPRLH